MSNDLSLYGITEELESFNELLEMDSGEFTEQSEDLLKEIEHTLSTKTDSVVGFFQKEEDLIRLATEKIGALQAYKKSKQNKQQRFKDYIKICLEKTNREKFMGILNAIKLRKPSKVLEITNEDFVPVHYTTVEQKTVTTIDNKALKGDVVNFMKLDLDITFDKYINSEEDDILTNAIRDCYHRWTLDENVEVDRYKRELSHLLLGATIVNGKTSIIIGLNNGK